EVGDGRRGVGEVGLERGRLVVGVALLGLGELVEVAHAGRLLGREDGVGVEGLAGGLVEAGVGVVVADHHVGLAVAVEVADGDVLIVAAGQVALLVDVAAADAGLVGREAGDLRSVGVPGVHDVGGVGVGGRGQELELAVAVEVGGGQAAHLVLP